MDTFFIILKKSLIATALVVFAFVATYIPQPHNQIPHAHAGGLAGGSTEVTQIANNVQLGAVNIATTASAGFDAITSWATNNIWIKEFVLDGIGWAIAKRFVSMMVQSLIDWINSGFQGAPAFVTDLKGFLLQAADEAIGEYLSNLGGIFDFVCSPFRLDVQISVALEYQRARADGGDGQPAPSCTLSGVVSNIENFISGSFTSGGLDDWFDITSTPQTYTPYGSVLSARAGARARIVNAQGEEISLLDFGDGFLSGELCEAVSGGGEECFITKPGKIIEEALSFNLDSGRQSLITADEINEIIAALLGQLANTVFQGAAGLLGLSSGTGYTYTGFSGGSYVDELVTESTATIDLTGARDLLVDARDDQVDARNAAQTYEPQLEAYRANLTNPAARRTAAQGGRDDARDVIITTTGAFPAGSGGTIGDLNALITEYDNPATTDDRRVEIISEYRTLPLYDQSEIDASEANWETLIRP